MSLRFAQTFRNLVLLIGTGAFSSISAIIVLGLNTRSLGPSEFGLFSVIQAYSAVIAAVTSFESWQPVIRLGLKMPRYLGLIVASGLLIDFTAALVATAAAISGILLFSDIIGISPENRSLALIYSITLLTGMTGTPKGLFRLWARYDVLVTNQVGLALTMLFAAFLLWFLEGSLLVYVVTFAAITSIYNCSLLARFLFSTEKRNIKLVNPLASISNRRYAKLMLSMAMGTSLISTFINTRRHVALLIVVGVLGETAAGLFSVASRLVTVVNKLSQIVNQVLFPEILRSAAHANAGDWRKFIFRVTLGSSCVMMAFMLVGSYFSSDLVMMVGGPAYIGSASIFTFLLAAECVALAAVHLNPIIQSKIGTRLIVYVTAASAAAYVPLAFAFCIVWGAEGAAAAAVVTVGATYFFMVYTVVKLLKVPEECSSKS